MILWNVQHIDTHKNPGEPVSGDSQKDPRQKGNMGKNLFLVFVLLLAIGGGITLGWYFNKMSVVRSVEVTGAYFTDSGVVLDAASIPVGVAPDSISFMEVIRKIELLPYVQTASIRMKPSGRVEIALKERQPLGLVLSSNQYRYFDADGVLLPVIAGKGVDVPLVYGIGSITRNDTLRTDAFFKLRDFLIHANNDPVAAATISELAWSVQEGIVGLSTENGIRIVFGADNLKERVENWNIFYSQVISVRGPASFRSVDLRYRGQIITRES